jgi:hypothetical protein
LENFRQLPSGSAAIRFVPVAAKGKHFLVARKICKGSNLHDPASAMIVFCIHFVFAVFMRGKPFNVLGEPVPDDCKIVLVHAFRIKHNQ